MVNLSTWDWATHFRLHEAACLIAGLQPIPKPHPDVASELPSEARPVFKRLLKAYVLAVTQKDKPEHPRYPKEEMLYVPNLDPEEPLKDVMITREELRRWIEVMGIHSAYRFHDPRRTSDPIHMERPAWTPERKQKVREYRALHGLKKTAEHFKVSQATISRHVPAEAPLRKQVGPWSGLGK